MATDNPAEDKPKNPKRPHLPAAAIAPDGRYYMHQSPRCGAKPRGKDRHCRRAALKGKKRCALHGGRSTGPAPGTKKNLRHGRYSAAAKAERSELAKLAKKMRDLLKEARSMF